MGHKAAEWLVSHGPLRHRQTRKAVVRVARRICERLGSDRLSKTANYGLDDKLLPYLGARAGTFLEVGANDGSTQSNTYYLGRRRGWTGILIEPIPELCAICRRDRPEAQVFNYAVVGPEHGGTHVTMLYGDLVSLVAGSKGSERADESHRRMHQADRYEVTVPARTLAAVVAEARIPQVDLVVVDVEGMEADVLRGFDWSVRQPQWVLVEIMDDAREPEIASILGPAYGPSIRLTRDDVLYVRRPSVR